MALTNHLINKLDTLWKRRTADLRAVLIPRRAGQPTKFTRRVRDRLINELLADTTKLLLRREGQTEFKRIAPHRCLTQIRGRGLLNRGRNMLDWAEANLTGSIIYVFWKGKKCLYVGKGESKRRLKDYEKSAYLKEGTCVEVFLVKGKSQLGKAECLAIHLFNPRDNRKRAAKEKWGKECPVCRKHDLIRDELNALFKMK